MSPEASALSGERNLRLLVAVNGNACNGTKLCVRWAALPADA